VSRKPCFLVDLTDTQYSNTYRCAICGVKHPRFERLYNRHQAKAPQLKSQATASYKAYARTHPWRRRILFLRPHRRTTIERRLTTMAGPTNIQARYVETTTYRGLSATYTWTLTYSKSTYSYSYPTYTYRTTWYNYYDYSRIWIAIG